MKKISLIALFTFLLVLTSHSQGVYSKQNLEQTSLEDLNLHLEKAHKLKKTGVIMSIAGPAGCLAGMTVAVLAYAGGSEGEFIAGSFLFLGGFVTTVVGLPILITGSTRVKRVRTAISNHKGASLNISPGLVYYNKAQNLYPGVRLSVKF